jgi:hypothetical protein
MMLDYPMFDWDSHLQPCRVVKLNVSNWQQNLAREVQAKLYIFWMNLLQAFTLQMFINWWEILQRLSDGGNTVVVIEHNLDVIKTADYIIDIGPEGGDKGGQIVAMGTPEEVAKNKKSYTGRYVAKYLE